MEPKNQIRQYYLKKIEILEQEIRNKGKNLKRIEALRNQINNKVKSLKDELNQLHEHGSHVGDVVKMIDKTKCLVKMKMEGQNIVEVEPQVDVNELKPNTRVCCRAGNYAIHEILPSKVDPIVSLMKVEKVPDST